ncbi:MAG: PEP-CTERM sorting domain-containing protein [Methylotenera sp.]|nr:PEP-CTERM sorting domain-containing protein [Methylotenera sp.]MDZ4222331.1 PEP-CTERM sorting domain-containing protein [Methylotenera sp.]
MNFKLKALVAAVVLSAAATSANAAISGGTSNGNSELVFSAWDSVAGVGYTYDLNWSKFLNDFVGIDQATTVPGNAALAANAVVQSSMIGAGGVIFDDVLTGFNLAGSSNVQWNLGAFDNFGRTRLLMTQGDAGLPFASTNNQVKAAVTGFIGYVSQANSIVIDKSVEDTFNTSVVADGQAYAGNMGNGFVNNLADTTNVLGGTSFMYFLAPTTQASSAAQALQQQLFSFDGKAIVAKTYLQNDQWRLQVAAVPEPETNAMMLAGLGLMGFIARRRRNNLAK